MVKRLTGRTRTVTIKGTYTCNYTLVYNKYTGYGGVAPMYVWFADYGGVYSTPIIPGLPDVAMFPIAQWRPIIYDPDLPSQDFEYGYVLNGSWVQLGTFSCVPSPYPPFIPHEFGNPVDWNTISFSIELEYEEVQHLTEYWYWNDPATLVPTTGGASLLETLTPGMTSYVSMGGIVTESVTPGAGDYSGTLSTGFGPYNLNLWLPPGGYFRCYSSNLYEIPDDGSGALGWDGENASWLAFGPEPAVGCTISFPITFVSTPGINNPPSLAIGSAFGNADWGFLRAEMAPGKTKTVASNTSKGYPKYTFGIEGYVRRWADPNPTPMSLVLNYGARNLGELVTITGVTNHFSPTPKDLGGYQVLASFSNSSYGGTPTGSSSEVNNYGSDHIATSPVARLFARVWTLPEVPPSPSGLFGDSLYFHWGLSVNVPSVKFEHLQEFTLLGGSWAFGTGDGEWEGNNAALTEVSGILHIETTSTAGAYARMAYDRSVATFKGKYLGYRFITVRYRSIDSDNKPIRIVLHKASQISTSSFPGGHEVDLVTDEDGVWKEVEFDIWDPTVQPPVLPTYQTGAQSIEYKLRGFEFKNLAVSTKYEVEFVKGKRHGDALISVMDPYDNDLPNFGIGESGLFKVHGLTDGMGSFVPQSQDVILYGMLLIGGLKDFADANDTSGWVVTELIADPADPTVPGPLSSLGDPTDPTGFLEGGGILIDNTLPLDYVANQETGGHTLRANPAFGNIRFHIAAGDFQTLGSFGTDINVVWNGLFGAQLIGTVHPATSSDVHVRRVSDNADLGSATPNAEGYFATGSPYPTSADHPVKAEIDSQLLYHLPGDPGKTDAPYFVPLTGIANRNRHYVRFWAISSGSGLDADTAPTGRTSYAESNDGTIYIYHSLNFETTLWEAVNTGLSGIRPRIRFVPGDHTLWMVYLEEVEDDDDIVHLVRSLDGGSSWDMALNLGPGNYPTLAPFPTGWVMVAHVDSFDQIIVRGYDIAENELFNVIAASSVADHQIALTWDGPAQRWYILYKNGASDTVMISSTNGTTWA